MSEIGEALHELGASSMLKEGIVLKELLENQFTEFILDASEGRLQEEQSEERIDEVYSNDDITPYINLECIKIDEENDPTSTPFEIMRKKMISITDDGKITKLILRHGHGEIVPKDAVIYFHYNSYFENEQLPFDSSYLRNSKPLRVQLGGGTIYLGLEMSLQTMKANEKSHFLVDPEYAFGKMGVPPRIPPNATILLDIELIKIVDCGAVENSDAPMEDKEVFSVIYSKAKGYHALGNDFFGQGNIGTAIDKYRKAVNLLISCKLQNDEEENRNKKLLLKLYLNLCVCYNHPKIRMPEKVCIVAKEAFYVYPIEAEKSAKLFFNLGKAFISLNEFQKAGRNLRKALSLEPHNKDINELLLKLEEKKRKYYESEKLSYKKALQLDKPLTKQTPKEEIKLKTEFEKVLREQLKDFASNNTSKMQLPEGLSYEEKSMCQQISKEFGLTYEEVMIGGKRSIYINK